MAGIVGLHHMAITHKTGDEMGGVRALESGGGQQGGTQRGMVQSGSGRRRAGWGGEPGGTEPMAVAVGRGAVLATTQST
jgi:hypothetical protein